MVSPDSKRPRVLSGIQPTGQLHLGNYLGALRNWAADQDRYENYFCIVDLHAMTVPPEADSLRQAVLELAATYLAAGLDPEKCEIFAQSRVPAHNQLGWLMECFTPMGWLERMTQFKDRSARAGRERVGTGLFTYPALMAADIVLYDTDYVPVGDDQRQHVEFCRDLVQRMNARWGSEVLRVPQVLTPRAGARVMGLDDPTAKMSKSLSQNSPGHAILLLDAPDVIRRKIMRAKTDASPAVTPEPEAGVTNLLDIYSACAGVSPDVASREFVGKGYGVLKSAVADVVIAELGPLQERYSQFIADPAELSAKLARSSERVEGIADATLLRVQRAAGLR